MRSSNTITVFSDSIAGCTSSYALARDGHEVTLHDRHRYPLTEPNCANGRQMSTSNVNTSPHPSTFLKGLTYQVADCLIARAGAST